MVPRFLLAAKESGEALRISEISLHSAGFRTKQTRSKATHRRIIHVRGEAIVTIGAGLECADENARLIEVVFAELAEREAS